MILFFQGKTAIRLLALLCVCAFGVTVAYARPHKSHKTNSRSAKSKHGKSRVHRARKPRGQQNIDSERTRQIQTALIREHYLNGEASGQWDDRTRQAMTHYQADHGWQTRTLPDSRALIALGLGPDRSNLLNPETAALPQAVSINSQSAAPSPMMQQALPSSSPLIPEKSDVAGAPQRR